MVSEKSPSNPMLGPSKIKIAHALDVKHRMWGEVLKIDKSPASMINEMGGLLIILIRLN